MTTAIALENGGKVILAADTRITTGRETAGAHEKIFQNGDVWIAASGSVTAINFLRYEELPRLDTWDVNRWMTLTFCPAVKDIFVKNKLLDKDKVNAWADFMAIIVVDHRAYYLSSDFTWWRNGDGRYAIGSGREFALGALYSGCDAEQAMFVAHQLDQPTGSDIDVVEL